MKRAIKFFADRCEMGSFARWTALWIALLAMAFQALLYAEHVSASAARNVAVAGPDDKLGFLEICTGDGVVILSNGELAPGSALGSTCLICASASVVGFDQPAPVALADCAFGLVARLDIARASEAPVGAARAGSAAIRAPPLRA